MSMIDIICADISNNTMTLNENKTLKINHSFKKIMILTTVDN